MSLPYFLPATRFITDFFRGAKLAMNAQSYQAAARRTAKPLNFQAGLDHMAMGVASDFGELVTVVKAMSVYGKGLFEPYDLKAPEKGTTQMRIRDEAGDCCWFISYGCDLIQIQFIELIMMESTDPAYRPSLRKGRQDPVYWAKAGASAAGAVNEVVLITNHDLNSRAAFQSTLLYALRKVYVCVEQICFVNGLGMIEVWDANITKLRKRYPDSYSDKAAIERKDV